MSWVDLEYGPETDQRMREAQAEVKRRNREVSAAHWSAVGAEVERLEAAGATMAEVTAELARRWSAWAHHRLWDMRGPEDAYRCERVLGAILSHLYLPGPGPRAEFPVNRGDLVRWGVVETVRDGGLALRDLAEDGVLGFGARGHQQRWRIPARAVCLPPAPLPYLDYYEKGGELVIQVLDLYDDGWTAPDGWTLEDAPIPVAAELGPLSRSVLDALPLSGSVPVLCSVRAEELADALRVPGPVVAAVLETLETAGLAERAAVGCGWFRCVAEAAAGE